MDRILEQVLIVGVGLGLFFLLGGIKLHQNERIQPTADYTLEIANKEGQRYTIWRMDQFVTDVQAQERICVNHPGIGTLLAKDDEDDAVHQGVVPYANYNYRWDLKPLGSLMRVVDERCAN